MDKEIYVKENEGHRMSKVVKSTSRVSQWPLALALLLFIYFFLIQTVISVATIATVVLFYYLRP